jgi:hypothetical protein
MYDIRQSFRDEITEAMEWGEHYDLEAFDLFWDMIAEYFTHE